MTVSGRFMRIRSGGGIPTPHILMVLIPRLVVNQ